MKKSISRLSLQHCYSLVNGWAANISMSGPRPPFCPAELIWPLTRMPKLNSILSIASLAGVGAGESSRCPEAEQRY